MTLRVGTRGSLLATTQTEMVIQALRTAHPDITIERVIIETSGDRRRESLLEIGGQGVFTKELEYALLDGRIDVAVHSLKDLPSTLPDELILAATPTRAAVQDVMITRTGVSWEALPQGAVIGTGSLRRRAQLLAVRPDFQMKDIRGNVDTRLAKLERGDYDAIVLAAAGLERLGKALPNAFDIPLEIMLPAPAQGILGLECRADDIATRIILQEINDSFTRDCAFAERAVLRRFGMGCRLPIAAYATSTRSESFTTTVTARVIDISGKKQFEVMKSGPREQSEALGAMAAEELFRQGAMEMVPLWSKKVVVTRPRAQAQRFIARLESLGATVLALATIEIVPPADDYTALDAAIATLEQYDWVVFTSANGVHHFWERLTHVGKSTADLAVIQWAVVGEATAEALAAYGINSQVLPETYVAEELITTLSHYPLEGKRILMPRADIARQVLPDALTERGAKVTAVDAYRTIAPPLDPATIALLEQGVDVLTFTSSSTVRNFVAQMGEDAAQRLAKNAIVAVIGPITAQTAHEVGLPVTLQAETHTTDGLIESLIQWANTSPPYPPLHDGEGNKDKRTLYEY
jgi:hydroxymethylbilane synthase